MADQAVRDSALEGQVVRAVTLRSMSVAVLMIAASTWWNEWMSYDLAGSNISRSHFPLAFLFPYMVLVVGNMAMAKMWPHQVLTQAELHVILAMGLVAIAVPYDGVTGHLIGVIAGVYYFASSENGWAMYLHEHVPTWIAPQNTDGAMTYFFEGMPEGQMPSLEVWIAPLFWWTLLIGAMAFAVFCMVVMLRKQWIDHERLTYPLMEVGSMLSETETGGRLSAIFRSPLFWIAFGIVMGLKLWNIGSYFTPAFPNIPIEGGQFRLVPDFPVLIRRVSFYAIGFGYFARLDVLFSVWFFVFATAFEVYGFNKLGYTAGAANSQWQSEALAWQSGGALIFLALWSLWMARRHLLEVWQKAISRKSPVDDSRELLSYRTATLGLMVSLFFITAWLLAAGMELFVIATFLPIALLTFLGLSRVVAELGLVYVYYQVQPYDAVVQIWGTPTVGASSVTALGFMRTFNSIGKGFVMPAFAQAVKAVDHLARPRQIAGVILLSLLLGYVFSLVDILYLCYTKGAYNMGNMGMKGIAPGAFNWAVNAIRNPIPMGGKDGVVQWAGIGAVVMAAITMVRYWVPWWPLHPIGLAIQGNYGVTKTVFSIFIVWAIKFMFMRIGGVKLYDQGKPFFIGLLFAQAVSTALVFVVDCIWFPLDGHNVHNY